ncbi:MAG: EamA family transporter [Eubacteriales bacterium]|nr:EamA family transporter [Eubacteriales bacterium]
MSAQTHTPNAYLALILTFSLWGSLYVVSYFVLGKLPAFTISFIRFTLAWLMLSVLTPKEQTRLKKKDFPYILLLGAVGYFLAVGAQLLGTKIAGSAMTSLINSLNPVTMTLFGALLFHEKLTRKKLLGICLALVGVYCILGFNARTAGITGILLSLFAVVVWSFVSVISKRVTGKYHALYVTRLGTGIAALCYLPVSIVEITKGHGEALHILVTDIPCILALLYMGFLCTGLAYQLWNYSLTQLDASTCSSFYPIQPMISTFLGILCFHEVITRSFVIGSLLIIAGVLLSLSGQRKYC